MEEKIIEILKQWKEESKCDSIIQFKYSYLKRNLTIYTYKVGYLIGKGGMYYDKYLDILTKEPFKLNDIDLVETSCRSI